MVRHLKRRRDEGKIVVPLRVVVKSTPSSMHSLYELSPFLDDEVFCAATVDTVFREQDFAGYVKALQRMCIDSDADGLMAVTAHIDDSPGVRSPSCANACREGRAGCEISRGLCSMKA